MVWEYERLEEVGIGVDRRSCAASHSVCFNYSAPGGLRYNWRRLRHMKTSGLRGDTLLSRMSGGYSRGGET